MRPGRTKIPDDKALPQIERLLDADAVAPSLERMLGGDAGISSVRVAYVRYRPAKRLLVVYELRVRGRDGERRCPGEQRRAGPRRSGQLGLPASRWQHASPAARWRARRSRTTPTSRR